MRLLTFEAVDSTQLEARRALDAGLLPIEPVAVLARTQHAGRGRDGRGWQSPPGGVWMTVCVPLEPGQRPSPRLGLDLGLAVHGVCAAAALELGRPEPVRLKWPNDIMLADRKLAGLLAEVVAHAGRSWVLAGIGVNLAVRPQDLSAEVRAAAATLGHPGPAADHVEFAVRLACAVADAARPPVSAPSAPHSLREVLWRYGEQLDVRRPDGTFESGRVIGVGNDGELQLETARGVIAFHSTSGSA
ncbi:MAG: biotin--[acetyl-CoA-carboxylase] ligase [Phycisphaerales bacterium]